MTAVLVLVFNLRSCVMSAACIIKIYLINYADEIIELMANELN